jgi:hypothetical protein
MAAALEIGRYLIAHALAAFDYMGADPRLEAARRVGRWIVTTHQVTFTKREAFRALRGQSLFPTIDRLTAGLAVLDEHGWIRGLAPERGPGRPPARYETNPAIFLQAWTKWPEPAKSPNPDHVLSILSMDSARSETSAPVPDEDQEFHSAPLRDESGQTEISVEEDYPWSALDPNAGDDDPQAERWLSAPVPASDLGVGE